MINTILNAFVSTLTTAGLNARRSFPTTDFPLPGNTALVTVALEEAKQTNAAAGEYLGIETNAQTLARREIYGFRYDAVVALTVWSSRYGGGAAGVDSAFSSLSEALSALPSGLRIQAISRDAIRYDADSECFCARVSVACSAYLYGARDEGAQLFTDFNLKGVLTNAN